MRNLIKNTLRYVFKNKLSMIGLLILLFIAITAFTVFTGLSKSMMGSYNNLVNNYDLHNIVIYDKWSDVPSIAEEDQEGFYDGLKKLDVQHRPFNSIQIVNGNNQNQYKVIQYDNTYNIDKLDVFNDKGLPVDKNNQPTLPTGLNFNAIVNLASKGLHNDATKDEVIARQLLVYFASNAAWSSTPQFGEQFKSAWDVILKHPNIDPYNPDLSGLSPSEQQAIQKIQPYIKAFVDPNNNPVVPPKVRGSRITFVMDYWNNNIPATGYFDDPSSYLAVVSPDFVKDNNKEIYPFAEYRQEIGNSSNFPLHPTSIEELSKTMPNTDNYLKWFNSIPDKYKVFVNNIPYLIVGTGITPDFMYPIISFQNVIPNPHKEAIVYTNDSGYNRTQFSFPTAPHESFIVAKYDGSEALNAIVSKINVLAQKYMAWPSNITSAYTYNNSSNQMSPATLRVVFIVQLVSAIQGVSIAISIFIVILAIFVMALFAKRFIQQNKTTIAILISNGVNKLKVLTSIAMIGVVPCIIAGILGFIAGYYLQSPALGMFSQYWMIPTPLASFNVGWFFFAMLIPAIIFALLTFFIGLWMLKENLVESLKEDDTIKVGFMANLVKKLFSWGPIMLRFRGSLAFASVVKIFFLIVMTTITGVVLTFVASTAGKLEEVNSNDLKSNTSNFAIDYFTPTIEGGQYMAVPMNEAGRILHSYDNGDAPELTNQGYNKNIFYAWTYQYSPAFREYSAMHWPSASDSTEYANNILYLRNKTEVQNLLNDKFGVGSLAVVPWNVPLAVMPTDQINTSNEMTHQFNSKLMTDMRPYNEAYFFNTGSNSSNNGIVYPNANNGIPFPRTWAIQNFGIENPSDWALSYGMNAKSENYGVISAPEIPGFNSAKQVANMDPNEIARAIDLAYHTYNNDNYWPDNNDMMNIKYYPTTLFKNNVISNVRIDPNNKNIVLFDVNVEANDQPYLITTRSIFKQYFEVGTPINQNTNMENITLDPFANTTTYGYKPNISTNTGLIAISYKLDYVNFFLHAYIDPAYENNFYRIMYNQVLYNSKTDEPYTYINATVDNEKGKNNPIQIIGIVPNSRFVNLYDTNTGKKINDLLFTDPNELIINRYAARKYGLKVGDKFRITPNNTIWRYTSSNPTDIITNSNNPLNMYQPWEQTFTVVGINNTGHNAQFYTSMESAQNILGLATASDYANKQDITVDPTDKNNYTLNVGMNNQWNTFGGFNGMFTSQEKPSILTTNLNLYSPNGLYPGNDSWEKTQLIINIVRNTLTKYPDKMAYLANALNMTVPEFINSCKTYGNNYKKENPQATKEDILNNLIDTIINGITEIYGKMSLASINSSADALKQSATMFESLSSTFDQIEGIVATLVIVLSLIIVILLSWMIVLDMLKLAAVLKTLGYGDMSNAWNFFCAFIPTWLVSLVITIPLTMLALSLLSSFMFTNVGALILAPLNWWAFVVIQIGIAFIFAIIFFIGMSTFKKINIVEVLKW